MKSKKIWLVMLIMVLAFGMTVVGCGGDNDPTLTASQNELRTEVLDAWDEMNELDRTLANMVLVALGFPRDPPSWSNADWIRLYEIASDIEDLF